MVQSLVKRWNYPLEGNDTNNYVLIEHKLFPNSSIHFLAVAVVTRDSLGDMQNEKCNIQRDIYICIKEESMLIMHKIH